MKKKGKKDKKKVKRKVKKPRKKSSLKVKKMESGGDVVENTTPQEPLAEPVVQPIQQPSQQMQQTAMAVPQANASVPAQTPPATTQQPLSPDVQIMDEEKMHVKGEIPVQRLVEILGRKPREREIIGSIIIRKCFLRQYWKIER